MTHRTTRLTMEATAGSTVDVESPAGTGMVMVGAGIGTVIADMAKR